MQSLSYQPHDTYTSYLQDFHVVQHDVTYSLIVAIEVCVWFTLPEKTIQNIVNA